jgi:hypothetical protein
MLRSGLVYIKHDLRIQILDQNTNYTWPSWPSGPSEQRIFLKTYHLFKVIFMTIVVVMQTNQYEKPVSKYFCDLPDQ